MISRYYRQFARLANEKSAVKKDPQRHRVYAMERAYIGTCIDITMSIQKLRAICDHACKSWGVEPCKVTAQKMKGKVFGHWFEGEIILNQSWNGMNLTTLLHELAHHIHDELGIEADEYDHGHQWVCIYALLLDQYKIMPLAAFKALCKKYNVTMWG